VPEKSLRRWGFEKKRFTIISPILHERYQHRRGGLSCDLFGVWRADISFKIVSVLRAPVGAPDVRDLTSKSQLIKSVKRFHYGPLIENDLKTELPAEPYQLLVNHLLKQLRIPNIHYLHLFSARK
jgi:hypothetical protein